MELRDEFIDEMMRHESPGDLNRCCTMCSAPNADLRCLDCLSPGMTCQACLVAAHSHGILHRIQVSPLSHEQRLSRSQLRPQRWTGMFFVAESLSNLGIVYQLDHHIGERCKLPSTPTELTLFDISGVHIVHVTYCFCNNAGPHALRRIQLIRMRWFPATWERPSTVFTFRLLDFLHKLQTRSKISLYDAYATLVSIEDSAGLKPAVVSLYQTFLQSVINPPPPSTATTNSPWCPKFGSTSDKFGVGVGAMLLGDSKPLVLDHSQLNVRHVLTQGKTWSPLLPTGKFAFIVADRTKFYTLLVG